MEFTIAYPGARKSPDSGTRSNLLKLTGALIEQHFNEIPGWESARKFAFSVLFLVFLMIPLTLYGQRLFIENIPSLGMGGAALAIQNDENIFFYNPALLSGVQGKRLNIFDLALSFDSASLDYYKFYRDNKYELDNIDSLTTDQLKLLYRNADAVGKKTGKTAPFMNGPISINYINKGIGIGLFSAARANGEISPGSLYLPMIDANIQADFLAIVSLSQQVPNLLPGELFLGTSIKFLYRKVYQKYKTISGFTRDEGFDTFTGTSFGIDVGTFYRFSDNIALAWTFFDLFAPAIKWKKENTAISTPVPDEEINPSFRIGLAITPWHEKYKYLKDLTVALDLDQPFNNDITFFKKIFFGFQARPVTNVNIRSGFYQGYPGFGIGFETRVLRFDYAYYSCELGKFAGQISNYKHVFRFQIGFGL